MLLCETSKHLFKYLVTAHTKSVFKAKMWKNLPWPLLSQRSMTVLSSFCLLQLDSMDPLYKLDLMIQLGIFYVSVGPGRFLKQFRGSWDERRMAFWGPNLWGIRALAWPCHILTTFHTYPGLQLSASLPISAPACVSILPCTHLALGGPPTPADLVCASRG